MTCPTCPHLPHPGQWCPSCACFAHLNFGAHARYHTNDPDTSREAAERLTTGDIDRLKVLAIHIEKLRDHGERYAGLAGFEGDRLGVGIFQDGTGKAGTPWRRRSSELKKEGNLRATDEVRVDPDTNRGNEVLILTAAGVRYYCRVYNITPTGPLAAYIAREDQRDAQWAEAKQAALW